jgi:hypothetical protein
VRVRVQGCRVLSRQIRTSACDGTVNVVGEAEQSWLRRLRNHEKRAFNLPRVIRLRGRETGAVRSAERA